MSEVAHSEAVTRELFEQWVIEAEQSAGMSGAWGDFSVTVNGILGYKLSEHFKQIPVDRKNLDAIR